MSILKEPCFWEETAAIEFVESIVWPDGPVCPHCGEADSIGKLKGNSTRLGTCKCYHCNLPFTVKIGTFLEASRLPIHVWLQSIYFLAQSDFKLPARELEKAVGISGKTARSITHRVQKALEHSARGRPAAKARSFQPRFKGTSNVPRNIHANLQSARPRLHEAFSLFEQR